jgi:hypothetical protein
MRAGNRLEVVFCCLFASTASLGVFHYVGHEHPGRYRNPPARARQTSCPGGQRANRLARQLRRPELDEQLYPVTLSQGAARWSQRVVNGRLFAAYTALVATSGAVAGVVEII